VLLGNARAEDEGSLREQAPARAPNQDRIIMHLPTWLRLTALTCALLLTACSKAPTSDIKTQVAADETVKFAGYKTYSWFAGVGMVRDDTGKWDDGDLDIAAELKFLIDRTLRDRGLNEAPGEPDLFIGFLVVADVNQLKEITDRGGKVTAIEGVGESALVIELIDAKTERTIWVGAASADAQTGRSNDEVKARLDYAVTELFKGLPRE
jgi:hypothetical protein